MTDAISRQSVIDMLEETKRIARRSLNGAVWVTFENVLDSLINITNALPTIQPVNNSEIPNSSDTISRQAAIDALDEYFERIGNLKRRGLNKGEKAISLDTVGAIKSLPPTQPELHWIPVTQATPTEDDDYWATFEAETGRFVDWASWYHGRWVVWIEGCPAPLSNVIAWCYPIEPYKGVTE